MWEKCNETKLKNEKEDDEDDGNERRLKEEILRRIDLGIIVVIFCK